MGNFPIEFLNRSNCSYVKIKIHESYSLFGSEDGKWEKENEEIGYHFGLFGRKENERGR